tara:strand:+ start:1339 stop:2220 length:882 start_codon:yes stop_codon:yes gene_type:complete
MKEQDLSRTSLSVEFFLFSLIALLIYGAYFIQNQINRTPEMQKVLKDMESGPLKFQLLSEKGYRVDVDIIRKSSSGLLAKIGDRVKIRYRVSFVDGSQVDSSAKRMAEEDFVVGFARAIPGLDLGIRRVPEGSRARITVPWPLAYGEEGLSNIIPPRADLIFDLEVIEIKDSGIPRRQPNVEGLQPKELSAMKYWTLREGLGTKPKDGEVVRVAYAAWDESGRLIHSSYFNEREYEVRVGQSPIKGWNDLLKQMLPGQQVYVRIPPELALQNRNVKGLNTLQSLYFWLEYQGK